MFNSFPLNQANQSSNINPNFSAPFNQNRPSGQFQGFGYSPPMPSNRQNYANQSSNINPNPNVPIVPLTIDNENTQHNSQKNKNFQPQKHPNYKSQAKEKTKGDKQSINAQNNQHQNNQNNQSQHNNRNNQKNRQNKQQNQQSNDNNQAQQQIQQNNRPNQQNQQSNKQENNQNNRQNKQNQRQSQQNQQTRQNKQQSNDNNQQSNDNNQIQQNNRPNQQSNKEPNQKTNQIQQQNDQNNQNQQQIQPNDQQNQSINMTSANQQNSIDTEDDNEIDHSLHFRKNSKQLDKRFASTRELIRLGLCDYNGNLNPQYFHHSLNKFDMGYQICQYAYRSGFCDLSGYPTILIERKDIYLCNNSSKIDKQTRSFKDFHSLGLCDDNGDLIPQYLDSNKTKFDMTHNECKAAYRYGYCDKNGKLHISNSKPENENLIKKVYLRKNSDLFDRRYSSFKDFSELNLCDSNGKLNREFLVDDWRLDLRRPNCNQAYQMGYCDDYGRIYINGQSLPEFIDDEYSQEDSDEEKNQNRIYQPVSLNFSKYEKSKLINQHTTKPPVVYNYDDFLPKYETKKKERKKPEEDKIILKNVEVVNGPKKINKPKKMETVQNRVNYIYNPSDNPFVSRSQQKKVFILDENKFQSLLNQDFKEEERNVEINNDLTEDEIQCNREMPLIKFLFIRLEKQSKVLVIVILILFYCFLLMQ